MLKRISLTALLAGAVSILPIAATNAAEGPPCGPRKTLTKKLEQSYGETRQSIGLTGGNAVFEVWVSEKTGSWTVLLTRPDGTSCVRAVGQDWQSTGEKHANAGDPV